MLKTQLSLSFVLVLCGTILLIILYINESVLSSITKNIEVSRLSSFSRIQNEMDKYEENIEKIMQHILFNPQVKDFGLSKQSIDYDSMMLRKGIGDILDKLIILYPELHSIFLTNSNGDVIGTQGVFNYNYVGDIPPDAAGEGGVIWKSEEMDSYVDKNKSIEKVIAFSSTFKYGSKPTRLVINVKETSFYNIYEPFSESQLSDIYICDRQGNIISAGSAEFFESQRSFVKQLNVESQQGSLVYKGNDSEEKQLIYQTFNGMGWMIVEEIPLHQYTKDIDALKRSLIILVIISAICSVVLSLSFIRKIMSPFNTLITAMNKMRTGNIGYQIEASYQNEFGEIIECFNAMSCDIKSLVENNQKIEKQKMQYAIAALKAQINPHFLFNTINMVKWMAIAQKNDSITKALEMLGILLKPLFKDKTVNVCLKDELEYAENYIKLINLRFGGNISLINNIPSEMNELEIPHFTLQPIIENCVEHGFKKNYVKGEITVGFSNENGYPMLLISDNGQGMTKDELNMLKEKFEKGSEIVENGDKIGMANVNLRLRLTCGEDCGLTILSNEGEGTTVVVRLQ